MSDNNRFPFSNHTPEEMDELINALRLANHAGLTHEFLDVFLGDYAAHRDITRAILHALCEWDL